MVISLEQLHSGFQLQELHISFICKEVLNGLSYIHKDLAICHSRIQCDNIFIDKDGCVKIADIGACLLERHQGSEQIDIRSLGWMMTEIMEPGTADANRRTINLEDTNKWSSNIIDFQRQTEKLPIEHLLRHDFLAHAPSRERKCLVVPMIRAKATALHDYE
ncbi:kinase-like domain-containing protein [Aspergillus pseudonomiae]|uniref:Kinase-like domain-containing protein n=1 Tax=Aspergillus pseudonomiae TaxID=1506151 RepID=A0A5N7DL67_9EURO|nr:kinase-like domain-containing protein [Aspergillus pseudonomiae]KAE8407124.1 kinase-like domain-containing protein [Aspergillus pseudonomiae]